MNELLEMKEWLLERVLEERKSQAKKIDAPTVGFAYSEGKINAYKDAIDKLNRLIFEKETESK